MAKLDRRKLRKVQALAEYGATEGERAAAHNSLEAMARKAGVSLDEALAFANRPAPVVVHAATVSNNPFAALFSSPEWQAEQRDRETKRAARRSELLAQFGSQEAVMAPTARETALAAACAPLAVWRNWIDADGTVERYVSSFDGFGMDDGRSDLPDSVRDAVSTAVPLPSTVAGVFVELREAEDLRCNREQFERHYGQTIEVQAREYVLESLIETIPAESMADVKARFAWARWMGERDLFQYHADAFLARCEADFKLLFEKEDR